MENNQEIRIVPSYCSKLEDEWSDTVMNNLYAIVSLRGMRVEKKPYRLFDDTVDNDHLFIGLSYFSTLPPFIDVDLQSLLLSPELTRTIGCSGVKVFTQCPLLVFQIPDSNLGDLQESDNQLMVTLSILTMSIGFSMACWIMRPSAVFCDRLVLEYKNTFISNKIHFINYDSRGYCSETDFSESDLIQLIYYGFILLSYATFDYFKRSRQGIAQFQRIKELMGEDYHRYEHIIPFQTMVPGKGPSFFIAIINLRKYLESSCISDRFRYGCTIFESILATDDKGIKVKLAKRVAAVIASDENEGREIFSKMKHIYTLRSGENHGDGMTFDSSTIDLSKSLDDYLRRLFNYILFKPSLNYGSFDGEEATVTKKQVDHFFQSMVKKCGWFES